MTQTPTLKTFLWFNENLEAALAFYAEVFGNALEVSHTNRMPDGKLFTAGFSIFGHEYIGMSWADGPVFNDSISMAIQCDGQDQVDYYWNALTSQGGKPGQCGWLVDPFGLSWQVTPIQMGEHLGNPDPKKAAYANAALRRMTKIVLDDFVE
jgi:predicted 3-demethylubiquinone-9 3-methyltransferase (glyoxalase superfamily)